MSDLQARITAYNGHLVFELLTTQSSTAATTSLDRPGSLGQVIHDTAKHLGVSKEAVEMLKSISKSHDAIGDIDWFKANDGIHHFAWLGGPKVFKNPAECEGSRDYEILSYVEIPNDVPDGAKVSIDACNNESEEK